MRGYTDLITAVIWEQAAFGSPEPLRAAFRERAMRHYHESAKDEDMRRKRGDRPDDAHLTYL